jgi:NitT/TauT family transport system substrate-binding protein
MQGRVRRGRMLRAMVAVPTAFGIAAHARRAGAQGDELIRFGASPFEAQGIAYYAQELGYYKRAGLNVDVQIYPGGAAILAAIAGGSLQIGFSNPLPLANARERGLKFVFIAPGYLFDFNDPPRSMLVVGPNSTIRGGKDLNGKTVAGTAVTSVDTIAAYTWIDAHGGDSSTVKFVELPQGAMGDAVATGRVDAATISEPALGAAIEAGKVRNLGYAYGTLGKRVMISGIFSTEEWATKHPEAVKRLQEAGNAAAAWAVKNPEAAAAILLKYTKISIPRVYEYHAKTLDPKLIQPVLDGALRYKFLRAPMDAREIIWKG